MKNGKKPTRSQAKLIRDNGLNSGNWFVVKDMPDKMVLVHRHSERTMRTIYKETKDEH